MFLSWLFLAGRALASWDSASRTLSQLPEPLVSPHACCAESIFWGRIMQLCKVKVSHQSRYLHPLAPSR